MDPHAAIVLVNSSDGYLVILPGKEEPIFRPAFRFCKDAQGDYHRKGPARFHRFQRFSPSDWSDATPPYPAAVQALIDDPPAIEALDGGALRCRED